MRQRRAGGLAGRCRGPLRAPAATRRPSAPIPAFLGWGRAWTDEAGRYEFRTIRPGGYADPAGPRAPHINLLVIGSGIMGRLLTTVFLPEEAGNATDPVLLSLPAPLRPRLVARLDGSENGIACYGFDLLLHGTAEAETPFFED